MELRLLPLEGAFRRSLDLLLEYGLRFCKPASFMSSTTLREHYQTCSHSSSVRLLRNYPRSHLTECRRHRSTERLVGCLHTTMERLEGFQNLSPEPVPTHFLRCGVSLRAGNSCRHNHVLLVREPENIYKECHYPSWPWGPHGWTPLHCADRLIFLADFSTVAGMDWLLLQHYPRSLSRLGCFSMVFLLRQRTSSPADEPPYISAVYSSRAPQRIKSETKSRYTYSFAYLRWSLQHVTAQRMALYHLHHPRPNSRCRSGSIVGLDSKRQVYSVCCLELCSCWLNISLLHRRHITFSSLEPQLSRRRSHRRPPQQTLSSARPACASVL